MTQFFQNHFPEEDYTAQKPFKIGDEEQENIMHWLPPNRNPNQNIKAVENPKKKLALACKT